jgi:hypothetical protein
MTCRCTPGVNGLSEEKLGEESASLFLCHLHSFAAQLQQQIQQCFMDVCFLKTLENAVIKLIID